MNGNSFVQSQPWFTNQGLNNSGKLTLGAYGTNTLYMWNGNISEAIYYDRDLTDEERQRVDTYMAIKYGVSLSQDYLAGDGSTIYDVSTYDNSITGVAATGGNADLTADFTVTFPSTVNEYVPNCWPRQYGKWLQLIRYDGETGASSEVEFKAEFNKGTKPVFDIGGIDNFIGQQDEIEIVGYCDGSPVSNAFTTSLKYPSSEFYGSLFGTVDATATGGEARTSYIYYGSPYWKWSNIHVEFSKEVDEVRILWRQKSRTYAFNYYQYLYISEMVLECPFVPECQQEDDIYANITFDQNTYSTCDTATMYLKMNQLIKMNYNLIELNIIK